MFAAAISLVKVVQASTVVAKALPYAKVIGQATVISAALNGTFRLAARAGAGYVRREQIRKDIPSFIEEVQSRNGNITRDEIELLAMGLPSLRKRTVRQEMKFLWDVTWTSCASALGATWAVVTSPIWIGGKIIQWIANGAAYLGIKFKRLFRRFRFQEQMAFVNARVKTQRAYNWLKRFTLDAFGKLHSYYQNSLMEDVFGRSEFTEYVVPVPGFDGTITVEDHGEKVEVFNSEKINDLLKGVPDSEREFTYTADEIVGDKVGFNRLEITYHALMAEHGWTEDHIRQEPERVGMEIRKVIREKHRKQLRAVRKALAAFAFANNLTKEQGARFVMGFENLHLNVV